MKKIFSVLAAAAIIAAPQTILTAHADNDIVTDTKASASEKESPEFEYTVIDEKTKTAAITSASGFGEAVEIPSEIDGYTVTEIGSRAFFGIPELTSVKLPDTLVSIGDAAFAGCLSLNEIILPDSVISLGNRCFYSCISLKYAYLGKSLREIPDNCFNSCTSLSRIYIPETTEKIGDQAFFVCADLSGLYIPASVTDIGENAVGIRYDHRGDADESSSGFVSIAGFIIRGESGSAAEEYAMKRGLYFMSAKSNIGDVNADGVVDANDASAVLTEYARISSGHEPSFADWQNTAADWNLDGVVDANDASAILTEYARSMVQNAE